MNIKKGNTGVVRGVGGVYGLVIAITVIQVDVTDHEVLVKQGADKIWYSLTNGFPSQKNIVTYTTYQLDIASITNEFAEQKRA